MEFSFQLYIFATLYFCMIRLWFHNIFQRFKERLGKYFLFMSNSCVEVMTMVICTLFSKIPVGMESRESVIVQTTMVPGRHKI